MEVKPVKQTEKPNYPLKTELNQKELKKQIPERWMRSPAAKVALGTLTVITLAGCTADGKLILPLPFADTTPSVMEYMPEGSAEPARLTIAPLFIHGGGSGAFGCVMIAPPVFLSEDEALTIINETAKEYGLSFSFEDAPEFANVLQPVTKMYPSMLPAEGAEPTAVADANEIITLKADFSDNEHGIAIEYISTNDVSAWNQSEETISAGHYDTRDAAAQLSEALEDAYNAEGSGFVTGVLYDPCETFQPDDLSDEKKRDEAAAKAREMSEEQLKKQAKDFFEWLKSQGVI